MDAAYLADPMGGRVDAGTNGCMDAFSSTIIDVDGDVPVLLNVPLTGGVCNWNSFSSTPAPRRTYL